MANVEVILHDQRVRRDIFRGVRKLRQGTNDQALVRVWGHVWEVAYDARRHAWVGDYLQVPVRAGTGERAMGRRAFDDHVRRIPHVRRMQRGKRYARLWRVQMRRLDPEIMDFDVTYGFSFVRDARLFLPDAENTVEEERRWLRALETAARYGILEPVQHSVSGYAPREVKSTNEYGMVISETRNLLVLHVDKPAWGTGLNFTPYTEAERQYYA